MCALLVYLRKIGHVFRLLIERLLEQAEIWTLVKYELFCWGWREPLATFWSFVLHLRSGVLRLQVAFRMCYSGTISWTKLRFAKSANRNIFLLVEGFGRFRRRAVLLFSFSTEMRFRHWWWAAYARRNSHWLGSSLLLVILKLCFDRLIDYGSYLAVLTQLT